MMCANRLSLLRWLLPLSAGVVLAMAAAGCPARVVPCADVGCDPGFECEEGTESCVPVPPRPADDDAGSSLADSGPDGIDCVVDCIGSFPVCDRTSGICKTCTETEGCSGDRSICDNSGGPGRCVECLEEAHCGDGQTCHDERCVTAGDAGVGDDGGKDAGEGDAGPADAGASDAGPVDAGSDVDAGEPDAGSEDAGQSDAGPMDAGPTDAGLPDAKSCATHRRIEFPEGELSVSFQIDTTGAGDDHTNETVLCATPEANRGPELVYELVLETTATVTISAVSATGSTTDPVLYVRSSPCTTGTEIACSDNALSGNTPESVALVNAAADTYYIFFDTFVLTTSGNGAGPMDVSVSLSN